MYLTTTIIITFLAFAHASLARTITVLVGANNTLTFQPTVVVAAEGDVIAYEFHGGTHSVVQSTFDKPCVPSADPDAINTGAVTYDQAAFDSTGQVRTYKLAVVNASVPLWIMCGVPSHCQKGMVMVVNPTANKTFSAFKSTAIGLTALTESAQNGATQLIHSFAGVITFTVLATSAFGLML